MRARGRVVGEVVVLRAAASVHAGRTAAGAGGGRRDRARPGRVPRAGGRAPIPAPAPDKLSRREREILALLALGHTNREIAERVHLERATVEWHRARIQSKLHVTGRAALAQIARRTASWRDRR